MQTCRHLCGVVAGGLLQIPVRMSSTYQNIASMLNTTSVIALLPNVQQHGTRMASAPLAAA